MGCGILLSLPKELQQRGGGLKICCITPPVENLFTLMGFDKLFGIVKTREDAVKDFGRRKGFRGLMSKIRKI